MKITIANLTLSIDDIAVFREVLELKGLESVKATPICFEIDDRTVTEQVECSDVELQIMEDVLSSFVAYEKEVIV